MYHVPVLCDSSAYFEKLDTCVRKFFSKLMVLQGPHTDRSAVDGYPGFIEATSTEPDTLYDETALNVRVAVPGISVDEPSRSVYFSGNSPPIRILVALLALLENFGITDLEERNDIKSLTDREMEVLRYVSGGYSNREIAGFLHITERTVKYHVSRILEKLEVSGRTEAVVEAARHGLLTL
jgi:DNA-binding CsgD family transcriptional regulator